MKGKKFVELSRIKKSFKTKMKREGMTERHINEYMSLLDKMPYVVKGDLETVLEDV